MLFKRKGSLKREYDNKLLFQIEELKQKWKNEKSLYDKSFDMNEDFKHQVELTELKYLYLFREAKARQLKIFDKNK
ncbi:YaaL family protein [Caldifermentibacillus hisashii]|uniref:YaaL family protein n=1 Tax=Caldifermentibacillus hisashii TaxID=996558 RepID=UPI001C0FDF93|nr:YaaL family protein [Caldifermentibacillus hisashii]MBU5344133.1 YaaL family protein [Caldifermentibacillus hisashii]